MSNSSRTVTFWQFLSAHRVEIPIIQRDYAQGRQGATSVRRRFLADLKTALDGTRGTPLVLDFVYGTEWNGRLSPLDGQQRLTTLWLIHWYLALRAGALSVAADVLRRFTYETRTSSREFCAALCEECHFVTFTGENIAAYIVRQSWFPGAWKNDPTIDAMLRMLSGTPGRRDGIEFVFACDDAAARSYWQVLISSDAPIQFLSLSLQNFGLSDDLYVKMNARGKPLTSFENFKADLEHFIERKRDEASDEVWHGLADPEKGVAVLMDTKWTDSFWRMRSKDCSIDEIFFAFVNRYFLNAAILQKGGVEDLDVDGTFRFLYGYAPDVKGNANPADDARIAYLGFDEVYGPILEKDPALLGRMAATLAGYESFRNLLNADAVSPSWAASSSVGFLPSYAGAADERIEDFSKREVRGIARITQTQRIVFHALCRFFETCSDESDERVEVSLADWMRVVWNIVENANIDTVPAMVGGLRLIDELSEHANDIVAYLAQKTDARDVGSSFAKEQIGEEIEKAKLISRDPEWKKLLREAEALSCLKGRVGVLLRSAADEGLTPASFGKRLALLEDILETGKAAPYYLQKVLLSRYEGLPVGKIDLSDTESAKKILLTETLSDCFARVQTNDIADNPQPWVKDLVTTSLLEKSRGKMVKSYRGVAVLWGTTGCRWHSFGENVKGNVALGVNGQLLLQTDGVELHDLEQRVVGTDFVSGLEIGFSYLGHSFAWAVQADSGRITVGTSSSGGFDVPPMMTVEQFAAALAQAVMSSDLP